ncbi:hypothetical protein Tco_0441348, partial [Tanacetum coccineum]
IHDMKAYVSRCAEGVESGHGPFDS